MRSMFLVRHPNLYHFIGSSPTVSSVMRKELHTLHVSGLSVGEVGE
jgi:hypothetical protein